jgi:hypothetical protein
MPFGARSGTVVVRPTLGARAYVQAWAAAAADAPWGDVDQTAQMYAMGRVPWCSFTMLPVEYCATAGDCVPEPVILHDSTSRGVRKIGRWTPRCGPLRTRRTARWQRWKGRRGLALTEASKLWPDRMCSQV